MASEAGEKVVADCPTCSVRAEAEVHGTSMYASNGARPGGRFVLAQCKTCRGVLLLLQENLGNMAEGDIWEGGTRLYPARQFFLNPAAPDPVRHSYEEAIKTHEAGAYTAAAVMCRRAVEGLCASHNVKEANLARSLGKLRDNGVINEHLFEWADMLRIAGNEAAHDVAVRVSKQDSRDMLEFTGAIIDYVFSFRDKFVAFKARRAPALGRST